MKLKKTLGIWALLLGITSGFAANDIYFSKIGIEHGLSQLSIQSIYQDELGAMWFATREGVNRFNGNNMEVFQPLPNDSNSLCESIIQYICGDKNGHVFIHTQNGVNEYDLHTNTMRLIQRKQTDAIAYGIRNLWMAEGNRLYAYSGNQKSLYLHLSQSKSTILKILQTTDQRILLGTLSSGVFMVDQNRKVRQVISDCSQVSCLFEDSKKNIWIATWHNGLYRIDRNGTITNYLAQEKKTDTSISSNFVRAICEDNNGFLWIGTKKGLDRLSIENGIFKHYDSEEYTSRQLSNESVWSLMKDNQGTIWAGTYFGGVNYFNPEINFYVFHDLQMGIFHNKPFPVISSMVEDRNQNLYLCSEGDGLIYYNTRDHSYINYRAQENSSNSLTNDNIKASFYDAGRQELWLGTHLGGLCKFNLNSHQFTSYRDIKPEWEQTNIVRAIVPYGDNLLIATYNGIFLFDRASCSFRLFSEQLQRKVSYCVDLKIDQHGLLWIANIRGVFRFDPRTGKCDTFLFKANDPHSLSNNNATKILIDSKNRIWIATSGGGVNRYNENKNNFTRYNSETCGLRNNFVSNLLESKFGYLLLTTTQGFSMLDPESGKLHNYGMDNGLPLNSLFNGGMCLTSKGELFLAGMNGMVSFLEENLTIPHRPFNLNLVNLWVNNKLVTPGDETGILEQSLAYTRNIELNYKQSMLTIELATNNYIPANQPVFRYKLEGFSDSWNELPQGLTKLNFMNLNVGRYKLIVQAVSPSDGAIISHSELGIEIFPPFYRAWYAYLIYVLLIIFIIWRYLVFVRSRLLLQTSLTYEKKEKEHLEEVSQSKLRFFTNISHEFRTPLTLIMGQVDMLLQMANVPPSIYNRILNIKRNTLNMQRLINELLEFRKSEQGHLNIKVAQNDIVKFLYEIYLSFAEYANYRQIRFSFNCDENEIPLWFDSVQLQKVFYNLISNAFKFTPKDGTIQIVIHQDAETVQIQVIDSGIGIAADAIEKIFDSFYQAENGLQISNMVPGTGIGLALTKNILELHQASIQVDSQPQIGSRFTVSLRKGGAHFPEEMRIPSENGNQLYQSQMEEIDEEFMSDIITTQVADNEPIFTMLIVEDNDELRDLLQQIFSPIYKIITAVDGVEGLEKTVENQPDIILSDLMMPRMSGSEMCSKIKHNFAVCHIPVVLLTAQTSVEYNIEGLRLGADDYITKPFNVKTLITRCNNLVNNRRMLQEKFSRQTDFSPRQIATNHLDREFLEKAQAVIERHIENADFDVTLFSREMALGRTKLFSKIKGITGQTPNDFIMTIKMKKAADLLNNHPEYNISDITYMLGFSSPKYFAKCFKEQFGVSPSNFRKGGDESEDDA